MISSLDPLTADLARKTQSFLSIVEEDHSPIKSSLSDVPQLRDAYVELQNIARALDQYARTNRGLRYIGLMGTFSSGKSSVINSLLGQTVRTADLPPIDDEITILTHPANRDALMGAHSRGLLKVTTQPVEAELLQNCFLVDTPGSGDPEIREGMVKDFLPICDLILYVFSATSALSQPDLSVLRTLQDQLDFVPVRFVITRADEFKRDRDLPFNQSNIDHNRADQFLVNLIGRIHSQAPKLDLSSGNFFLIDNWTKFGVAELKTSILRELQSEVQLHSKKIAYFRRGISTQKAIFQNYLTTLIDDVTELEHKAKINKENYENNVVLSFQSINDFWQPREGAQTTRVSTFAKLAETWEAIKSREPIDLSSEWLSQPKMQAAIEQRSIEFSHDFRRQIIELGNSELFRRREELEKQFPEIVRGKPPLLSEFIPGNYRSQLGASLLPSVVRTFRSAAELTRSELMGKLRDIVQRDQTTFQSVFEHARRGDLITKDNEYYREFEAIIRTNLREFLPLVALFKSYVTSAQARNLIARTGLGEKLDVLDTVDVDVVEANAHTDDFLKTIFVARATKQEKLRRSINALLERQDLVESELAELRQRFSQDALPVDFVDVTAAEIQGEKLLNPILDRALEELAIEIKAAQAKWDETLRDAHNNFLSNLRKNRSQVLITWLRGFTGILGLATFLGALAIAGIFATGLQGQLGWALTVLSGALTTITVSVFGWAWRRFSSSPSKAIPKSQSRIASEIVANTPRLAPINIEGSDNLRQIILDTKDQLKSATMGFLTADRDAAFSRLVLIDDGERSLVQSITNEVNAYIGDWSDFADTMKDWYRPDEFKRELISGIATSIKQRAIEPALTLFADRLNEVRNFANRLHGLLI